MAKSNKETKADELDQLTGTESFIDKYKKAFIIGGAAIVVVVLGIIGYQKLVVEPNEIASQDAYWNAFYDFQNDSLNAAVAGTNEYEGMEAVASEYGGTSGGDIANYSLGIAAMKNGSYDEAIGYFDECDFDDVVLGSMTIGLKGDCYVEMGELDKAVDLFEKAAQREENVYTTPMYLMKAGLTHEKLGDNQSAVTAYEKIKKNWPKSEEATSIEKYIARAQN